MQFRVWPVTAAVVATLATTAGALASPTLMNGHEVRAVPQIQQTQRQPAIVRRPVAVVAPRPMPAPRADVGADGRLLARIDQIRHESCAAVMRERPDFDPSILAGIIEQRQDACRRAHFGFRRGPHQFGNGHADRDDRALNRMRLDDRRDDRRISALRADDRRDDRRVSALRADDRRDDGRVPAARFGLAARSRSGRTFAADRHFRPMGRPRPI